MTNGSSVHVSFAGGRTGAWRVVRMAVVVGPPLIAVDRLAVLEGPDPSLPADSAWVLHGVTSYERYVHRAERSELVARQAPLGRPEATRAALIPISKSAAWWELSQDQRRAIFEEHSNHIATGLEYLPAIARRLHHARDLGGPFDFPNLVRIRARLQRPVRGAGRKASGDRGVGLCGARSRHPAGSRALGRFGR